MSRGLSFSGYSGLCRRTAQGITLPVAALGVAGEAGEVAEIVKKIEGHGWRLEDAQEQLIEEVGDLLWYCSVLCDLIGTSLMLVANRNIEKLEKRYPYGFIPNVITPAGREALGDE